MMTESLDEKLRVIRSRPGHNIGNLVIRDATITSVAVFESSNPTSISAVLQERNERMKGMNPEIASLHPKALSFGRRGLFAARSCSAKRMSEVTRSSVEKINVMT